MDPLLTLCAEARYLSPGHLAFYAVHQRIATQAPRVIRALQRGIRERDEVIAGLSRENNELRGRGLRVAA